MYGIIYRSTAVTSVEGQWDYLACWSHLSLTDNASRCRPIHFKLNQFWCNRCKTCKQGSFWINQKIFYALVDKVFLLLAAVCLCACLSSNERKLQLLYIVHSSLSELSVCSMLYIFIFWRDVFMTYHPSLDTELSASFLK